MGVAVELDEVLLELDELLLLVVSSVVLEPVLVSTSNELLEVLVVS